MSCATVTYSHLFLLWPVVNLLIKLTSDPILCEEALSYVRHASCGAVSMFEGDIRNENTGDQVLSLEYEVYENLFHKEVTRIGDELKAKWAIHDIAVIQRVGLLQVGDAGIVICISSAHRRDSLEGLAYAIEEFKKRVPVWKKERTTRNERWINWTPQS